jgi:hypothetical protein
MKRELTKALKKFCVALIVFVFFVLVNNFYATYGVTGGVTTTSEFVLYDKYRRPRVIVATVPANTPLNLITCSGGKSDFYFRVRYGSTVGESGDFKSVRWEVKRATLLDMFSGVAWNCLTSVKPRKD